MGTGLAKAAGGSLASEELVTLPFARVCQVDVRVDSKEVIRSFVWSLRPKLVVTVACSPFDESKPSTAACMQFAASLRAK